MNTRRLEGRRVDRVLVRLSAVDRDLRVKVAETIIQRGKLRGFEAASLMLSAYVPIEDPQLWVASEKADRVLRERKLPLGSMPRVWTW